MDYPIGTVFKDIHYSTSGYNDARGDVVVGGYTHYGPQTWYVCSDDQGRCTDVGPMTARECDKA